MAMLISGTMYRLLAVGKIMQIWALMAEHYSAVCSESVPGDLDLDVLPSVCEPLTKRLLLLLSPDRYGQVLRYIEGSMLFICNQIFGERVQVLRDQSRIIYRPAVVAFVIFLAKLSTPGRCSDIAGFWTDTA